MTPAKDEVHFISFCERAILCVRVQVRVGGEVYMWFVNATSFQNLDYFPDGSLDLFDINPIEVKYIAVMFYVDLVTF